MLFGTWELLAKEQNSLKNINNTIVKNFYEVCIQVDTCTALVVEHTLTVKKDNEALEPKNTCYA